MQCPKCKENKETSFRIVRTDIPNKLVQVRCKCGNTFPTGDKDALTLKWV